MDPVRIAQRARHKERKLPPPKHADLNPFQQKLHANPYARALSSPVRLDAFTQARLPSSLLLDLDVKLDPSPPHNPHLVPSTLFSRSSPSAPQNPQVQGPKTYVQPRLALLKWLSEGKKTRWRQIVHARMQDKLGGRALRQLVWRSDMEDFVLGLLRKVVERKLRWILRRGGPGSIVRSDGGVADAKEMQDVGCVIYTGSLSSLELSRVKLEVEDGFVKAEQLANGFWNLLKNARAKAKPREQEALNNWAKASRFPPHLNPRFVNPPLHFTTVTCGGRAVPVYSLVDMIGMDKTEELLKDTIFQDARCVVLKEGRITCGAQMWLLRLQAYLT